MSPDALSRARAAAESVVDPEIPALTIADMGILRDVRCDGDAVEVVITPTYSGCPAMGLIRLEIETALARAGFDDVAVTSVYSPPWTTDWLTDAARAKLGACGIAPPAAARSKRALFAAEEAACPRCGSADTERVSEFGATACKALYRCRACREPFEYFKCI